MTGFRLLVLCILVASSQADLGSDSKYKAEPSPCGGKMCLNRGHLNTETCKCECLPMFTGGMCHHVVCHRFDPKSCGFVTEDMCKNYRVAMKCAMKCGWCKRPAVCDGIVCKNYGYLDRNTCRCVCQPMFKGSFCGKSRAPKSPMGIPPQPTPPQMG